MRILKARWADADALARMILKYFPYTHADTQKVEKRISDPKFCLYAAREGSALLGFFEVEQVHPHTARLNGLAVEPPFRNRGWGARLLERAMACARELGAQKMILYVKPDNGDATRLYARAGFSNRGLLKEKIGGQDAELWDRTL